MVFLLLAALTPSLFEPLEDAFVRLLRHEDTDREFATRNFVLASFIFLRICSSSPFYAITIPKFYKARLTLISPYSGRRVIGSLIRLCFSPLAMDSIARKDIDLKLMRAPRRRWQLQRVCALWNGPRRRSIHGERQTAVAIGSPGTERRDVILPGILRGTCSESTAEAAAALPYSALDPL